MTLKKGERVRVVADWIASEDKQRRAAVQSQQKHGQLFFVKIRWVGADSQRLEETYGTLFEESELRKVG